MAEHVEVPHKGKVLIVEANAQRRLNYAANLKEKGFEVRACTSAQEALRILKSDKGFVDVCVHAQLMDVDAAKDALILQKA